MESSMSQRELLKYIKERHGQTLPSNMSKPELIEWLRLREGAGVSALSPRRMAGKSTLPQRGSDISSLSPGAKMLPQIPLPVRAGSVILESFKPIKTKSPVKVKSPVKSPVRTKPGVFLPSGMTVPTGGFKLSALPRASQVPIKPLEEEELEEEPSVVVRPPSPTKRTSSPTTSPTKTSSLLSSLRKELQTGPLVNPNAKFQSRLPPLKITSSRLFKSMGPTNRASRVQAVVPEDKGKEDEEGEDESPIVVRPKTPLKGSRTSSLPVRSRGSTPVSTLGEGLPLIELPKMKTRLDPIPPRLPQVAEISTATAVAHSPQEKVMENLMRIDPTRLYEGKKRKGDGTYPLDSKNAVDPNEGLEPGDNLRDIAASIGLPKSGTKRELVAKIKEAIRKINPQAFE